MNGKNYLSYLALIIAVVALTYSLTHRAVTESSVNTQTAYERFAKTRTLRCGYILYPPYLEKDLQTGKLQGVGYDLIESIGVTMHDTIEWVEEVPVGGETAALDKGNIDAVCSITGAYDTNNFNQLTFSNYLVIVKNRIFARADDARFNGSIDLAKLDGMSPTFAGIEGDTSLIFPPMLMPHVKTKALPQLAEPAQLFQELKYGKADLVMLEGLPGMKAMQANPNIFKVLDIKDPLPTYAVQIVYAKKEIYLKDTIDEAIRFMKVNSQFEPILRKYDPTGQVLIRAD